MKISQITLGVAMTNCFIIDIGKRVIIIDPVLPDFQIDEMIGDKTVGAILLTHGHFDHIFGTEYYSKKYHAPVYIHQNDAICLHDADAHLGTLFGVESIKQDVVPELLKEKRGTIDIDGFNIEYFLTPGHSRGEVIYSFEKQNVIFTGDLVFYESIGRYDLPRSSERDMKRSIVQFFQNVDFKKKNPTLYSGHGPKTTFQHEAEYNQMVRLFLEEMK